MAGCIETTPPPPILHRERPPGLVFLSLNIAGGTDTSDHDMARSPERAGYNSEETGAALADARVVAENGLIQRRTSPFTKTVGGMQN